MTEIFINIASSFFGLFFIILVVYVLLRMFLNFISI